MAIDLSWYQVGSQEVLHYIFHRNWAWNEIYELKKRADSMLQFSKHAIPVYFDFSQASQIPAGMLNHGRQIIETRHLQGSPLVVIGGDSVIRNTFKIAERMLNDPTLLQDVIFVSTLKDADRYVQRMVSQVY